MGTDEGNDEDWNLETDLSLFEDPSDKEDMEIKDDCTAYSDGMSVTSLPRNYFAPPHIPRFAFLAEEINTQKILGSLLEEEEEVEEDIETFTARNFVIDFYYLPIRDTDCGMSCTDKIALDAVEVAVQDLEYRAESTGISSLFQNTFSFSEINP